VKNELPNPFTLPQYEAQRELAEEYPSKPQITLRELMSELCWNWQPSLGQHKIWVHDDGNISVDKLYVSPPTAEKLGHVGYKTLNWSIDYQTYSAFLRVCRFLNYEMAIADEWSQVNKGVANFQA
jgi:hypothetical protein